MKTVPAKKLKRSQKKTEYEMYEENCDESSSSMQIDVGDEYDEEFLNTLRF